MKILQYCFKYHFWKTIIIFLILLILLYIWRKWKGNKGSWSSFSEIEKTYNLLNKDVISITKQIIHTDKVNPSDISLNLTSNLSKKSSDSKGEIICRNTLQTIFKKPFNKIRPDFLRNKALDNNMNLEIDSPSNVITMQQLDKGDKTLFLDINNNNNSVDINQSGSGEHYLDLTLGSGSYAHDVDISQTGTGDHAARVDLDGYSTDFDLLQQGSTDQDYNIDMTCGVQAGCTLSTTQGN